MWRWLITLGLLFAGCVGVPQPEPPSLDPTGVTPIGRGRNERLGYRLAPGSVDPAVGELWVVGLDDAEDPLLLSVEPDGSVVEFDVASSDVRLQARDGDERTRPWDFRRLGEEVVVVAPASPCLSLPLELEVGRVQVGSSVEATFTVDNGCAIAVDLPAAAMRRPSDLEVVSAPSRIEASSSANVRVRLTPSAEGLREETLLITVDAPAPERRVVTLFGRGLP